MAVGARLQQRLQLTSGLGLAEIHSKDAGKCLSADRTGPVGESRRAAEAQDLVSTGQKDSVPRSLTAHDADMLPVIAVVRGARLVCEGMRSWVLLPPASSRLLDQPPPHVAVAPVVEVHASMLVDSDGEKEGPDAEQHGA